MAPARFRRWAASLLTLLLLLVSVASVRADATVKGTLSSVSVSMGEDVNYELQIEGGSPDRLPAFPRVEGIQLVHSGRNAQTIFDGGQVRHTITYVYRLAPERPGEYTIPAIEVFVDRVRLQTAEQRLTVTPQDELPRGWTSPQAS